MAQIGEVKYLVIGNRLSKIIVVDYLVDSKNKKRFEEVDV